MLSLLHYISILKDGSRVSWQSSQMTWFDINRWTGQYNPLRAERRWIYTRLIARRGSWMQLLAAERTMRAVCALLLWTLRMSPDDRSAMPCGLSLTHRVTFRESKTLPREKKCPLFCGHDDSLLFDILDVPGACTCVIVGITPTGAEMESKTVGQKLQS